LNRTDPSRSAEGVAVLESVSNIRAALSPSIEVENAVFLPREGVEDAMVSKIPYASALLPQRPTTGSGFIIDSVPCTPGSYAGTASQDVRHLTSKLRCSDPMTFGVLKCHGAMNVNNDSKTISFEIVFEVPTAGESRTLRS